MILYHVTKAENVESIIKNGLLLSKSKGLMHKRDKKLYLTDSIEYCKIMAEDIAEWKDYVIFEANINESELVLIWWEGKKFKEWTTNKQIQSENLKLISSAKIREKNHG